MSALNDGVHTWRSGVRLVNGETIWLPMEFQLTEGQAAVKVQELAGGKESRPVPTHHTTGGQLGDQVGYYYIPASNILYHVLELVRP